MRTTASRHFLWAFALVLASCPVLYSRRAVAGDAIATKALRAPSAQIQPTYSVTVGIDGEVFPAFANYASLQKASGRRWGIVAVTVRNSTDAPLQNRISVQVPGWSDKEIQTVEVGAGAVRTYVFAPTFLPRFYRNREITAATAMITVTNLSGRVTFSTTEPVRIRSVDDMLWGEGFKFARFLASWVTPHHPKVENLLSRAKEFVPGRRLPGYEAQKSELLQERSTTAQARAIFRALHAHGLSYVKSSKTLGKSEGWSERVRMPAESLRDRSANCIDGALLYASLFENLGMETVIVLVPGHAYVALRLTPTSNRYLYIETSYTGRTTFETAVAAAQHSIGRYDSSEITSVSIAKARELGIYPMPE